MSTRTLNIAVLGAGNIGGTLGRRWSIAGHKVAFGVNNIYLGGTEQVDLVDAVAKLWFALALGQGKGRHLAFKVLTR